MKSKLGLFNRTDKEILEDLRKLGLHKEARAEQDLNYMITLEQEDDFYHRLKHQKRPSGVE